MISNDLWYMIQFNLIHKMLFQSVLEVNERINCDENKYTYLVDNGNSMKSNIRIESHIFVNTLEESVDEENRIKKKLL